MNRRNYTTFCRKITFALFFLCLYGISFAESYKIGGAKGWNDIGVRNGITTGKGRFGYECLELDRNNADITYDTDLLIDFEDNDVRDKAGHYTVTSNKTFISEKAIVGKGAALSRGIEGGLSIHGDEQSLFGCEGPIGSFKIDFWINPSVVDNGEVLLNWRSSKNDVESVIYQVVSVSFYQNKAMCLFSNIFNGYKKDMGDICLVTSSKVIPGKWSHHTIAFDDESGALEYRIDGELEAIKFITDDGHEGGNVYHMEMGVSADLELIPSFTGYLDQVRIQRSFVEKENQLVAETAQSLNPKLYSTKGGRFETIPLLTKSGTIFNSIQVEKNEPEQTAIQYYVRSGDNYFNWTQDYPEWKPVSPGEEISGVSGLYFQVAVELFPDGEGKKTPSVTELTLNWTTIPDPMPPFRVTAEKGNGQVKLSWNYSVDDSAGGYYIYYGTRPGEYLGRFAAEGPSPINVGNSTTFTLTGLENGTIYYFAIAAWSKNDSRISGPLSKEVFARPSVK